MSTAMSSKPNPKLGAGKSPVAVAVLEREIDARDVIQVVEDDQRRGVVQQRDTAGLQPAALLPAGQQAEQLFLWDGLEFPARDLASHRFRLEAQATVGMVAEAPVGDRQQRWLHATREPLSFVVEVARERPASLVAGGLDRGRGVQ